MLRNVNPVLIRRSAGPQVRVAAARRVLVTATLVLAGLAGAATPYRVRPGDNLTVIAQRAGISVAALKAANPGLRDADQVQAGKTLSIPNRQLPGQSHRVRDGENLTVIAHEHGLSLAQLLRANPQLDADRPLRAGITVQIPGRKAAARLPSPGGSAVRSAASRRTPAATVRTASIRVSSAPSASGWLWPVAGYRFISSGFGERELDGEHEQHYGVDIVAPPGTVVHAARSGRVLESRADFERGWGWTVVLEHPDGWITRYAHLSANLVKAGEQVTRGQPVGRVGSTGRSTGPHLHFGTYLRWDPKDPLALY
ncbi:M23 family metallopeptidase [Deinococcus metallilatus]|uniref:M23 family metallopeptidase n=1 Tax=Deinococcus metallilatus TaxID=1211322 RepID=A0AAJ5F6J0_9DEIO|nr:M23 family metallopeptidase [Deinococcus metallilatus]RXJ14036.1 M23 family metallopeptidase [Deinococcus metallilatus]TLK30001.1 M23 family metallopeptidase [Deinococcus metallilatus]